MADRYITGDAFHEALLAAGVVRRGEKIRRIVIDAGYDGPVVIHVERYGDERLLNVVRTLAGAEIREDRRPTIKQHIAAGFKPDAAIRAVDSDG